MNIGQIPAHERQSAPTKRGDRLWRGDVRGSTFETSILGEVFQCDITFGVRPGGVRWTLVAFGDKDLSRGVVCTGTTPTNARVCADIDGEIENDARSTLLTTVILHGKDWAGR